MGTVVTRMRKDGTVSYCAQILIKKGGKIVHRGSKTFDRKQAAHAWLEKREKELAKPGEIDRLKAPKITLAMAIQKYIEESQEDFGATKTQVLKSIMSQEIGSRQCSEITSELIVEYAKDLRKTRSAATVQNYISHLSVVFDLANPAWGYELSKQAFNDAIPVMKKLKLTDKSTKRDRRPTLAELDKLMEHFDITQRRRKDAIPMQKIIAFAIFSARRQEEITTIQWADLDADAQRILIRDMKHPEDKKGNDVWCDLPSEALAVIKSMPKRKDAIFPYNAESIGANFTRACKILGIEDLHFHDLRHEGISRLFEMGKDIPHAALVSGHRSWQSLQRYSHIRQTGDKFKSWKWLPVVT